MNEHGPKRPAPRTRRPLVIHVAVSPEELADVDGEAERTAVSRSDVVRRRIRGPMEGMIGDHGRGANRERA